MAKKYAYEFGKRWNVKTPRGSIHWLVAKMHVGESDESVAAAIAARIPANPEFTDAIRRECLAYAIECHARNRDLFNHVMRGV